MSAGGRFIAVQRGVYDTGKSEQRGLDVAARLRESHRIATIRPVRVTLIKRASNAGAKQEIIRATH